MIYKKKDPHQMTPGVIVLAAGRGKRMCSDLPKVLHPIAGKPLLFHILMGLKQAIPKASIALVVGYQREALEAFLSQEADLRNLDLTQVVQEEQKGTGHAVQCAMESPWGLEQIKNKNAILVLPGDLPLFSSEMITQMVQPLKRQEVLRLLTCELPDPTGYGRVIRGKSKQILKIVEEKEAQKQQKLIQEVAVSVYFFKTHFLEKALQKITPQNTQKEYYLTDLVEVASQSKKSLGVLFWEHHQDLLGVNNLWELAQVEKIMNQRILRDWAIQWGVRVMDPGSTWIDRSVELSPGVVIHPGAILRGSTKIGRETVVGPSVVLQDVDVGERVYLKTGTVAEQSKIDQEVEVGPYAHIRPGSHVEKQVKIGNFVELKKTQIGEGTRIAHLSYLGDAIVGKNVNIGCGFITCNYDGRVLRGQTKHQTWIEDNVFLGSDCQTVAPVRIGKGSFIASGSTITQDVEPDSLAIARARQVNKVGYAVKLKKGTIKPVKKF